MSLHEVVVEGTLRQDGILELDQKPNLAPGRVQVKVKPLASAPGSGTGLADVILQIQQDQKARGFVGLTAQELAAEQKVREEEDDEYNLQWQNLWSQTQSGPPD